MQALCQSGQPQPRLELVRQGVADAFAAPVKSLGYAAPERAVPQPPLLQLRTARIEGDDRARMQQAGFLVGGHDELVLGMDKLKSPFVRVDLPTHRQLIPLLEGVPHIAAAAKPDQGHRPGPIDKRHVDPPAGPGDVTDLLHRAQERGFYTGCRLCNRQDGTAIEVAPGQTVEEVPHRTDARFAQRRSPLGAHAAEGFYRLFEADERANYHSSPTVARGQLLF